jgi:hypothetical protein
MRAHTEHAPVHVETVMVMVEPKRPAGQSVQEPAAARLNLPTGHTDWVADVEPRGHEYPA